MTWGSVIRVLIWMCGYLLQVLLSKKHYEHRTSSNLQNQRLCSLMAMRQLLCVVQRVIPLLTGRFAHRSYLKYQGWLPHGPNTPMIQRGMITLPEMLQSNGYRTACIGKYHVGMAFDNGDGEPAEDFFFRDVDFTKPSIGWPNTSRFR